MTIKWYYRIMGEEFGPIDRTALFDLGARNEIDRDTFVRREDEEWVTADHIDGLLNLRVPGKKERRNRLGEIVGHRNPVYFSDSQE